MSPSTVTVRFLGPEPETFIPDIGAEVVRGEPFRCSAAVAGREPGEWETRRSPVDGWPATRGEDDADGPTWLVRDPGAGLLAQTDRFERVQEAASTPARPAAAAPAPASATTTVGADTSTQEAAQ